MAADNYGFGEGDSLLCYHEQMLYEAKCLKRRKANDGKAQYFIHYKGWNSKWEEWVDDNRVLSVNAANMKKMASLKEMRLNTKKSGGKRSITTVKEETIRNVVTPPTKKKNWKCSEISSDSNQTVNVPSPTETKHKKRGRPPKNVTSKIEETEVTKSVDKTIVTEDDVITESAESIEENKVIDNITKQDTAKKQSNALILNSHKKEKTLKKKVTPEEVAVIKSMNERIEEILNTKNVEVNKNIEATKEKKQTNNTAGGEINVHAEVENVSEELYKTKAVEPCEESKDIEETKTINQVEGSETVERNEDIKESETENVEPIENSEAEVHDPNIHEARDLEVDDLEAKGVQYEETDRDETESDETVSDEESFDDEDGIKNVRILSKGFEEIKQKRKKSEMTASTEGLGVSILAPVIPKINIPDIIRNRIAYDFHMVVHNKLFAKFRKDLTIDQLIKDFENSDTDANNSSIGITIIQYFNTFIHHQLLYPPEKKKRLNHMAVQCFKNLADDNKEFSVSGNLYPRKFWHLVYGPSYLIRLFVLLPEIVANYSYLESDRVYLVKRLETFMKFIANNFDQYFSDKSNDYCK